VRHRSTSLLGRASALPSSYTPKHLAERILTSKAALEGERKQVTVRFVDLKGSMELLADRDPEEARKLLALSAIETMGLGVVQPLFLGYLGEPYVLADRLEKALEFAGRALTLARESGQRPYEAWVFRLLGEVTARRDPPEHADGHYRDALALAEDLGMLPLVAHCHLGLGKLYRRLGKREKHLATATTMYREMDMRFWRKQVERELRGA